MALGDIIVFKKGGDVGIIVYNDAQLPDVLLFRRHAGKWSSQVIVVDDDDEGDVFTLASENDVPDDIPEDFWPTVVRYKLLGGDA